MTPRKISYLQEDHSRWSRLVKKLEPTLESANKEFKDGLRAIGLQKDRIPSFEEINERLLPLTGWQYRAAEGEVSKHDFLVALAGKVFLAETKIRSEEEFDFCKLPDIFHDVYGHAAMLAYPRFSDFLLGLGLLALKHSDNPEAISGISNIYWYTAEVGVIYEGDLLHYYGGSIISSVSEIKTVMNPATTILPYAVFEVINTSYNSYDVNDRYFSVNNLTELNRSLQEADLILQEQYRHSMMVK